MLFNHSRQSSAVQRISERNGASHSLSKSIPATIFSNSEFLYEEPLAISQISFDKKEQVENHVLMIGDSAGMITPSCGNGMSMALHAGKLAFEEIGSFLQGKI